MNLTKAAARGHDSWNFQLEMDMTLRLDASAADFGDRFTALLSMKRESSPDVDHTVRKIIEDVISQKFTKSAGRWKRRLRPGTRR